MSIKKEGNHHIVESHTTTGKFYKVDLEKEQCSCPAWVFRKMVCKHIKQAKEFAAAELQPSDNDKNLGEEVIKYVKEKEKVDSIELIEKFGEEKVEKLIQNSELIEEKGKIKIFE